jgi:hypothetical protein
MPSGTGSGSGLTGLTGWTVSAAPMDLSQSMVTWCRAVSLEAGECGADGVSGGEDARADGCRYAAGGFGVGRFEADFLGGERRGVPGFDVLALHLAELFNNAQVEVRIVVATHGCAFF